MKPKMARGILTLSVLAAMLLGAAGCGNSAAETGAAPGVQSTVQEHAAAPGENKEEKMNIKITVGNRTLKATLNNNAAARQLWNRLPITYPMKNLYGREMCYRMGTGSLPVKEAKDTGYQVGDISYWPPMGSLVILYKQNGEVFEQQPIGHIEGDVSFFNGMADTQITWEKDQ